MLNLSPGQTLLERFVLVRRLGGGGIGEVWLAQDNRADARRVALKVLLPRWADHPGAVELLRREFAKQRRLAHPNVLAAEEFLSADGVTVLVMPAVTGGDLSALAGAPLPRLLPVLAALADALAHAHAHGLVHRDLKPANVLLDDDGRPLLADFGVAAALDEAGLSVSGGGSLAGMSPQQLSGADPTPADDLYAFGVLCHRLLAGEPPRGENPDPVAVRTTAAPSLADAADGPLPGPLVELVDALLARSASDRPPDAATVAGRLRALADAEAPSAPGAGSRDGAEADDDAAPLTIAPVAVRRRRQGVGVGGAPEQAATDRRLPGGPAVWTGAAFAVLLTLALATVFWLPRAGAPSPPAAEAPVDEPVARPLEGDEAGAAAEEEEDPVELRREAEELLGRMVRLQGRLEPLQPSRWAGEDWPRALELGQQGDDALLARRYGAARDAFREALALFESVDGNRDGVYDDAVASGAEALEAGRAEEAAQAYRIALLVRPEDSVAQRGLERAGSLDEVLHRMREAERFEGEGDWSGARDAYAAALSLDRHWRPAQEGLQRAERALADAAFREVVSRGYAALADERYADAIGAFGEALSRRPDASEAREGLRQAEDGRRLQQITLAQARATAFERQERWRDAVEQYRAALEVDGNLAFARSGLERAQARESLDARLAHLIDAPAQLFDDAVLARARELHDEAAGVHADAGGERLGDQLGTLAELIELASTPVRVELRSDGRTDVSVFRVGRLGRLESEVLELRPGNYVAVGSRNGYRDVRVEFRVRPGQPPDPVTVVCRDPV